MPLTTEEELLQETLQAPATPGFTSIPELPNNLGGFSNDTPGGFSDEGTGGFRMDTTEQKSINSQTISADKQARLINKIIGKTQQTDEALTTKEQNLLSAHTELQTFKQELAARETNKETALISDENVNSILGRAGNLALNLATGATGLASTFKTVPARITRMDAENSITPEQRELYETAKAKNTLKDNLNKRLDSLIKTPPSPERDAAVTTLMGQLEEQRLTPEELYLFSPESARNSPSDIYETRDIAKRLFIADQMSEIIDVIEKQQQKVETSVNTKFTAVGNRKLKTTTDKAASEFKEGDNLKGVSTFLGGVATLATEDTQAAAEVFTKSLPYMIAMVTAGIVTIPAIATEIVDKSVESHKKEYGELPTDEERFLITILAYTSAGLDKIGATATKNAASITNSVIKSSKTLNKKLPTALIQGIKTVGAPVGAVAVEGATEGVQNVLEQVAKSVRDPKVDVSKALQDTAHGAIGGAIFSAPGVAKDAITASTKAVEPVSQAATKVVNQAADKLVETGVKLEQSAIKKTDTLIEEKSDSDPELVIKKIISDGLGGLSPEVRKNRIIEVINLNKKFQDTIAETTGKASDFNYDETIAALTKRHLELVREESTGKKLPEHIEASDTNIESITEVSNAITEGADLPLKTLDRVSGSTLFDETPSETQEILNTAIDHKKSLAEVSEEIKFGDEEKGTKGLVTHLNDVINSLAIDDKISAQASIDKLATWETNQQAKLAAYNKAKSSYNSTSNQPIEFTHQGETLSYHPVKSKKLLITIGKELSAISNTLKHAKNIFKGTPQTVPIVSKDIVTFDTIKDNTLIGELSDVELQSVISTFARDDLGESRADSEWIRIEPYFVEEDKRLLDNRTSSEVTADIQSNREEATATFNSGLKSYTDVVQNIDYHQDIIESSKQNLNKLTKTQQQGKEGTKLRNNINSSQVALKELNIQKQELEAVHGKDALVTEQKQVLKNKPKSGINLRQEALTDTINTEVLAEVKKLTNSQIVKSIASKKNKLPLFDKTDRAYTNIQGEILAMERELVIRDTTTSAPQTAKAEPGAVEDAAKKTKPRTVAGVINQPLTSDPVLAQDKIKALGVLTQRSGKLSSDLVAREARAVKQLGRVETLNESQLSRLQNYIAALYTDIRSNVKAKPSVAKVTPSISSTIEADLTSSLLADDVTSNSLFIKPGKTPSKIGTAKGLKAKDIFKPKAVENTGFFNTINDFYTEYKNNGFTQAMTGIVGDITADEVTITDSMLKFHTAFEKGIKSNISFLDKDIPILPEYTKNGNQVLSGLDQNPLGYLVKEDENGVRYLPENVIGLMTTTLYNWFGTRSGNTLINTDPDINSILGRDSSHTVTIEERSEFLYAGSTQTVIAETLGNQVVKQLGLTVTDQVDGNMLDRLALAIGLTMVATSIDRGYLTRSKINMGNYRKDSTLDFALETPFVKLTNAAGNLLLPPKRVLNIKNSVKLNPQYIDRVFGIESQQRFVTTEPVTTTPKFLKGTSQLIPKKLKKAILVKQDTKWEVKADHHKIVSSISRDALNKLSGFEEDSSKVHITQQEKVIASNQDIIRGLDNYFESIDNLGDITQSIYFEYESYRNMRTAITNNMLNPAANKLHRHLVGAKAWNVTVPKIQEKNSEAIRTNFKLSVAQSFGFSIDKNNIEASTNKFNKILLDPSVVAAIKVIKSIEAGAEITAKQEQSLIEAVSFGGEKLHTLDGLVALSQYHPTESFSTNLGIEVDGVTNGIAIGLMQAPVEASTSKLLQSVGIFLGGKDGINYPEWASNPTNLDLYQTLTSNWIKALNARISLSEPLQEQVTAITKLVGSFIEQQVIEDEVVDVVTKLGRDISKNPMMFTGYGSAIKNSVNNLTPEFIEKIYDKLTDASKVDNVGQATREVINDINSVIGHNYFGKINYNDPLNIVLPNKVVAELTGVIDKTYGDSLKIALESSFPEFFKFRNSVNGMLNTSFVVFNIKYQRELELARKTSGGKVLSTQKRKEIFDSLKEYQPIISSALSNNINDGLVVLDTTQKRDYRDNQSRVQINVGKTENLDTNSLVGTVSHTEYDAPGARGLVFATQSQDAAIQAVSGLTYDFLDVFDAKMLAVTDVDVATKETNQAMWDITTTYSVMDSVHETFKRSMILVDKDTEMRKAVLQEINKHKKEKDKITVNHYNKENIKLKEQISKAKKVIIETPNTVVSQYAHGVDSVHIANPPKDSIKEFEEEIGGLVDDWAEAIKKLEEDIDNTSGSSVIPIDFNNFNYKYDQVLSADNSLAIFEDMATVGNKTESVEHSNHLKGILTNIVNKVLRATDNIDFKVGDTAEVSHGAAIGEKVYINASTANRLNNNNEMSLQEIQVHELLHTTLNYAIDNNFHIRKELIRIFRTVESAIAKKHGEDGWKIFLHKDSNNNTLVQTDIVTEEAAAKERYDYIFNNTSVQNIPTRDPLTGKLTSKPTNDYLKEFVAFGLTNESFLATLSEVDTTPVKDLTGLSFQEKLLAWLDSALNWISGKLYHTQNLKADEALRNLVDQLSGVTSKQRNAAIRALMGVRDLNEVVSDKIFTSIVKPLTDWRLDQLKRPETVIGKIADTLAIIPESFHNSQLRKNIKEVLRNIGLTEEAFVIKLARELQGAKDNNLVWHTLLRQSKQTVDTARKQVSTEVVNYIKDTFQDSIPSESESVAITRVMYKSDMSVLRDSFNIPGLIKLLTSDIELGKAIKATKLELSVFGANTNYYITQARGLGNFIAKGFGQNRMQALNSYNIANLILDNRQNKSNIVGDAIAAEEIIDRLSTLYSLREMAQDNKTLVADVMKREHAANNQDNGITSLLNLQTNFKEESLKELFKGNKIQTIKGYVHETFNPRTDIKIGTKAEGEELLRNGYVKHGEVLPADSKDPNKSDRYLYVLKNAVGNTYLKSIVSLTSKVARGNTLLDGYISAGSLTPVSDANKAKNTYLIDSELDINRQFSNADYNNTESTLVPILNEKGQVTELRYMMTEANKIELLDRHDNFDAVIGNMFGGIKDKINSKQVNRKVVEMAYDDYQTGFATDPNAYVKISLKSSEKRYKELFQLVPEDMRRDIQDVWGKKEMIIRRELADLIFGYRKWSVTQLFESSTNANLKKINTALNTNIVRHVEAIWQEVVTVAKTNIVIRTPAVLIDNFISNAVLSAVKGVPITYMIKNQALAIRALDSYQTDLKAKAALELRLNTTPNLTLDQRKRLKARIAAMGDNLTTNPVSKLIDEGIFQAITEDVETSRSPYNFRDKVLSDLKLDKITNNENVLIRESVRQAFMTEETSVFKLLMKATQYSDFIARFALHKFNTEERVITGKDGEVTTGMSEEDSLRDVVETFVNYDIPTSKQLQYINDMGFFMFSKFLFRIQKVIFTLLKDRPVSVSMSILLQQVIGDAPDVIDSIGIDPGGRVGFILGPLDTATNISGLNQVGEIVLN